MGVAPRVVAHARGPPPPLPCPRRARRPRPSTCATTPRPRSPSSPPRGASSQSGRRWTRSRWGVGSCLGPFSSVSVMVVGRVRVAAHGGSQAGSNPEQETRLSCLTRLRPPTLSSSSAPPFPNAQADFTRRAEAALFNIGTDDANTGGQAGDTDGASEQHGRGGSHIDSGSREEL